MTNNNIAKDFTDSDFGDKIMNLNDLLINFRVYSHNNFCCSFFYFIGSFK